MLVADPWVTSATERTTSRQPKPFHAPRDPFPIRNKKQTNGLLLFLVKKHIRLCCCLVFYLFCSGSGSRNKHDVISIGWILFTRIRKMTFILIGAGIQLVSNKVLFLLTALPSSLETSSSDQFITVPTTCP